MAVKAIKYPAMLDDLEYFLRLIGYLRSNIHYYMQVAQPLQELKISLLKPKPMIKAQQKVFASHIKVP